MHVMSCHDFTFQVFSFQTFTIWLICFHFSWLEGKRYYLFLVFVHGKGQIQIRPRGAKEAKRHPELPTTKKTTNWHQKLPCAKEPSKESCSVCEEQSGDWIKGSCSANFETYPTYAPGAVVDETPIGEAGDALQVSFQIWFLAIISLGTYSSIRTWFGCVNFHHELQHMWFFP